LCSSDRGAGLPCIPRSSCSPATSSTSYLSIVDSVPHPHPQTMHTHNSVSFLWAASACLGKQQRHFRVSGPTKTWQGVLVLLGPQAVVTLAAFWLPSTSPTVMHLQQCMYRDSASHRAAAVCSQTRRHQRKERNETEPKEKRNCSAAWSRYTKRKRKIKRKGCLRARSWLGWLS
jgi:hypothetical protein